MTEAVIDFSFASPLSTHDVERVRDRFKRDYPAIEGIVNIQVTIEAGRVTTNNVPLGFKMIAKNAADLVIIRSNGVSSIRLAPYEGWDALLGKTQENFEIVTKIIGRQEISRIGVRYINRIDIPLAQMKDLNLAEFVNVAVGFPDGLVASVGPYTIAVIFVDQETGTSTRIQTGIDAPALLEHMSLALDIDAYIDKEIPKRLDALWNSVAVLRRAKNRAFEATITDRVRELFK